MIDHVDRASVEMLAERSEGPWVSLAVPTERVGPNTATKIQFKNLMTEAVDLLKARGTGATVTNTLRERGADLLDDAAFWTTLDESLVVFLSPGDQVMFRLAGTCDPSVVVSDHPKVDVLLMHVDERRPYAVLALSLKKVRLLRGDQHGLVEDDPPVLPVDLATALALDDREPQLQSHAAGRVGAGRTTAAFHGQGSDEDADTERFMRLVDDALHRAMPDDVPIVLAGVDRTVAAFRKVSRRRTLLDESIHGNADRLSGAHLSERAWPIVEGSA